MMVRFLRTLEVENSCWFVLRSHCMRIMQYLVDYLIPGLLILAALVYALLG